MDCEYLLSMMTLVDRSWPVHALQRASLDVSSRCRSDLRHFDVSSRLEAVVTIRQVIGSNRPKADFLRMVASGRTKSRLQNSMA